MKTLISRVLTFLNERADYALLRNFEGLPDRNDSRDIDIIISRESLSDIKRDFLRLVDASGWKVVSYLRSDRLTTFVCAKCDTSAVEMVQWDFFVNTSVWGIELMSAGDYLRNRLFNGVLYYVGNEYQFLDKYLYNSAVGNPYPEKYKYLRDLVEHNPVVEQKIKAIFGKASLEDCDCSQQHNLIQHALIVSMHHPFKCIRSILSFLYSYVRNYLFPSAGFSLGFTGPDGVGKTTVINTLLLEMGDIFNKSSVIFHFRPNLYKNLGEVAFDAGIKKKVDRKYEKPHRGAPTGIINSFLRLVYYGTDYMLGYWVKVKTQVRITRLVIFDRYYSDIICDSMRSSINLSPRFLYLFGRLFIPKLDYNILLTASVATITDRKTELNEPEILQIISNIDYLSSKKGYIKIINEESAEKTAREILSVVFNDRHSKIISRYA